MSDRTARVALAGDSASASARGRARAEPASRGHKGPVSPRESSVRGAPDGSYGPQLADFTGRSDDVRAMSGPQCARGATTSKERKPVYAGSSKDGSDGTRTRDLRRDR